MITQLLKRSVMADKTMAHICQIICSIVGGLVLVLGIQKLAALDLGEAELYTAMTSTLFLSGIFIALAFLCRVWRRAK